ncbi:MAG: glutamate 5-kinase [Pseudomonadota bacterium]
MDALDIKTAKRIVVKIGSALLVDSASGALRSDWLQGLCTDLAEAKARGADVIVVSSGSIALGRGVLGLGADLSLDESQAAASVGQIRLARAYEETLSPHGISTGQVLLTLEDSRDRRRYLNSRATVNTLLKHKVVPIVNENDTVATDEIRYGDNDRLAAQVAAMVGADVLVLLSDVDGLYTGNPKEDASATHIPFIDEITPEIEAMAGDAGSGLSKGGMKTKLMAAQTATRAGCAMVILQGDQDRPLTALSEGATATWFAARADRQAARKDWISSMKVQGALIIDDGAKAALSGGKSLLSAGVRAVQGGFMRGDLVEICGPEGESLAKGLVNYDTAEVEKILGVKTTEISDVLGYPGRGVLVHRDDMVM